MHQNTKRISIVLLSLLSLQKFLENPKSRSDAVILTYGYYNNIIITFSTICIKCHLNRIKYRLAHSVENKNG